MPRNGWLEKPRDTAPLSVYIVDVMDVSISKDCEGCGSRIDVPYGWSNGMVVPRPNQVRVCILMFDASCKELVEAQTVPSLERLILCEGCRETLVGDMILSLQKLREKRPLTEAQEVRVQ